jgi:hypothetical protein
LLSLKKYLGCEHDFRSLPISAGPASARVGEPAQGVQSVLSTQEAEHGWV